MPRLRAQSVDLRAQSLAFGAQSLALGAQSLALRAELCLLRLRCTLSALIFHPSTARTRSMSSVSLGDWLRDFKNPPAVYRPVPFWSWNEKIEPLELRRQIGLMADAGWGGGFIHSRI